MKPSDIKRAKEIVRLLRTKKFTDSDYESLLKELDAIIDKGIKQLNNPH
jgi:hypothetical protein